MSTPSRTSAETRKIPSRYSPKCRPSTPPVPKSSKKIVAERYAARDAWAKANPELAAKMESWFAGKVPAVDWAAIEQKPGAATRAASATVLGALATQVENMIVASADLSNSDKTDGFLKKTHAFTRGDFSGAFLQAGVSELTMACCAIGMALHGGVIPACATFFVFSDYMKPAARMAALMETPVKFIWTHDAFRVGEDGPTHEPVEQEAQIRLLEKLKNHKGHNSMLVLRPADAEETTVAWRLAMENTTTPTALIFSRQNIANLPAGNDYSLVAKGAYIVAGSDANPDVVLVASGSEVSTLVAGAEKLRAEGIKVRIVSAPSEGLFRNQSKEYQESVIPTGAKVFGLTRRTARHPRRAGRCQRQGIRSRIVRLLGPLQDTRRETRLHRPERLRPGKSPAGINTRHTTPLK